MTLTDTYAKSIKSAADTATDTFHDTGSAIHETAKDLSDLASTAQEEVKGGIRQLSHAVEDASSSIVQYVREFVQERPGISISIIAGAGLLLGLLLSNRR